MHTHWWYTPFQRDLVKAVNSIQHKLMTLQERLTALETKLDEGTDEILAELALLREAGVTPEAEVILARIESKVSALADVSPPVP